MSPLDHVEPPGPGSMTLPMIAEFTLPSTYTMLLTVAPRSVTFDDLMIETAPPSALPTMRPPAHRRAVGAREVERAHRAAGVELDRHRLLAGERLGAVAAGGDGDHVPRRRA